MLFYGFDATVPKLTPRTEVKQLCNNNALTKTFFLLSRLLIFISSFLLFKRSQTKLYNIITESESIEVENFETITKPRLFERSIPLFLIVKSFSNSSFWGRTYSSSRFSLSLSHHRYTMQKATCGIHSLLTWHLLQLSLLTTSLIHLLLEWLG